MAFVEVIRDDGSSKVFELTGEKTILGRSSSVAISIPEVETLAPEHILFVPRGRDGCWVSVSGSADEPVRHQNNIFQKGVVPWNATLTVANLTLRVFDKRKVVGERSGVHPLIWVAALLIIGWAAFMFIPKSGNEIPSQKAQPPKLFEKSAQTCPAKKDFEKSGQKLEHEAYARGDRYRYEGADGVRAVSLYAQAAACFKKAGADKRANSVKKARTSLIQNINADYAASRLRLSRALSDEQMLAAKKEVATLISLTKHTQEEGKTNAYVGWLHSVSRAIEARLIEAQNEEEAEG